MTELVQGSPEWYAARCGRITASRIVDVMAKLKDGRPAASRSNYMAELISERLTSKAYPNFQSAAMRYGKEQEAEARAAYEFVYLDGDPIEQVGFVPHPTIELSGASPDGFIGADGLIEFKCPNTNTHIATLLGASIDKEYIYQIQWQLECTGRQWCWFCSYDSRMPPGLQLFRKHVVREDNLIGQIKNEIAMFQNELDKRLSDLKTHYNFLGKAA